MHHRAHQKMWHSFLCCLLLCFFSETNKVYAQTAQVKIPPLQINPAISLSATDKKLLALLNQPPKASIATSPPKIAGHDIFLISPTNTASKPATDPPLPATTNSTTQYCMYNNQHYLTGDIVNTDAGWLRCTTSIFFTEDNPCEQQKGDSVWVQVE